MTENITFPQLRGRAVDNPNAVNFDEHEMMINTLYPAKCLKTLTQFRHRLILQAIHPGNILVPFSRL